MIRPIPYPHSSSFHSGSKARCILFFVVEVARIIISGIKLGYLAARYDTSVPVNLIPRGTPRPTMKLWRSTFSCSLSQPVHSQIPGQRREHSHRRSIALQLLLPHTTIHIHYSLNYLFTAIELLPWETLSKKNNPKELQRRANEVTGREGAHSQGGQN